MTPPPDLARIAAEWRILVSLLKPSDELRPHFHTACAGLRELEWFAKAHGSSFCAACEAAFTLSASVRARFAVRSLPVPTTCLRCREARAARARTIEP